MPFIAECLFCHGKLRAPDHAAGWSVPCPTCGNNFTLVPMTHPPQGAVLTAAPTEAEAAAITADAPLAPLRLPPLPIPPPSVTFAPRPRLNLLGLAAFLCGSLALLFASLPPLDHGTIPLGILGVLLGLLGLVQRFTPAWHGIALPVAGLVVSLPVLVLSFVWPDFFGPVSHAAARPNAGLTLAVPIGQETGHVLEQDDGPVWVDASKEMLQQDDLRVRVLAAKVKPLELKDPNQSPTPREPYLVISLRIYNVGAARRIDYTSWAEAGLGQEARLPELHDNTGRTYHLRPITAGMDVVGHVRRTRLKPASYANDLLAFEKPPAGVEHLLLELPAAAFGGNGTFRFQVPRSLGLAR
jgi:hypothetical protein